MTPPKLKRCEMNREENKDACSTKNVSLIFIIIIILLGAFCLFLFFDAWKLPPFVVFMVY